jgi:hypothetical protein
VIEPLIKDIIRWGTTAAQLVTAILAIIAWRHNKTVAFKVFAGIWVLTFLVETYGRISGSYFHQNNQWVYAFFFPVFYAGVVFIFRLSTNENRHKKIIAALSAGLLVVGLYLAVYNYAINATYNAAAGGVVLFVSVYSMVRLYLKQTDVVLNKDPMYWISAGLLLYFSYHTVLMGLYNLLDTGPKPLSQAFYFYGNHAITLILHVFLWKGFMTVIKWKSL